MCNNIVFETDMYGHHLEYLHHLHKMASNDKDNLYYFVVPSTFQDASKKLHWEKVSNIKFVFYSETNLKKLNNSSLLKAAYYKSKFLGSYVKKYQAKNVFLISLMLYVPFIMFFLPSYCKVSGIVYRFYLYEWHKMSSLKKGLNVIRYWILAHNSCFNKVLILNDKSVSAVLNKVFKTNKFHYLPDPVFFPNYVPKNVREELEVAEDQNLFLHFGMLDYRKGTDLILNALKLMEPSDLQKCVFIFAGMVSDSFRDDYHKLINEVESKVRIVILERFCSFEEIADLCFSSDYLLLPYKDTMQSSGVIGYCSKYDVAAIASNTGLLGKLVKRYDLGLSCDLSSPEKIYNVIQNLKMKRNISLRYCNEHTVDSFLDIISSSFVYESEF